MTGAMGTSSEPLPERAPPGGVQRHEEAVGRARRLVLDDGAELWRVADPGDPAVARLRAWGPVGLGGFVDAGRDAAGAWLLRSPAPVEL